MDIQAGGAQGFIGSPSPMPNQPYPIGKIYGAISAVMAEVEPVPKDKKNEQQGFKYRGIDQIYNTLIKVLAKHKVFTAVELVSKTISERKTSKGGTLYHADCLFDISFYTDDGSRVRTRIPGEGMDSGDKASNKAITAAHKYALLTTFNIPTEEMDDPDATTPPPTESRRAPPAAPKSQPNPQQQSKPPNFAPGADRGEGPEFLFTAGAFKGKRIKEVPLDQLTGYYDMLEKLPEKSEGVKLYLHHIRATLAAGDSIANELDQALGFDPNEEFPK